MNDLDFSDANMDDDKPCALNFLFFTGLCFSSGLGATTSIVHMLKAGDHVVSIDDVYGGTNRYFKQVATKFGLELTFCDMTNPENLRAAMTPATKVTPCLLPYQMLQSHVHSRCGGSALSYA